MVVSGITCVPPTVPIGTSTTLGRKTAQQAFWFCLRPESARLPDFVTLDGDRSHRVQEGY